MAPNPTVMQAVESLDYRVTVGDVAAQAGLDLNQARQGLLALASDTQAHLQVSESGEIAYEFPRNFRAVLRNKFWRLRLRETWERVWHVLFYLIRISFGILLIVSIVLIFVTIAILVIALNSSRDGDDRGGGGPRGGGFIFLPRIWFGPDLFWFFDFDSTPRRRRRHLTDDSEMNFFEAVFSFLFGDGDPNAELEDRRWAAIASVIRNHNGAVAAEQIAPFLDDLGSGWSRENEDFMLPVLSRFDGRPEVSPQGGLIYHFPDLQVMASERPRGRVSSYLQEQSYRFSQASSGQIMLSIGLGSINFIGALVLGNLLQDQALVAELGGLVAFVNSIYWLLLGYGTAFLGVPLVRYFWVQWRNGKIEHRNNQRQQRVQALTQPDSELQEKLAFAQQFAEKTIVGKDDLAYTTEKDLTEQEFEQSDKIDAEWQRRLQEYKSNNP
ncbi:uncharacterized protein XM38_020320 [Halomicronema hongdechloris C2206]|uniref:Uncharacterized protein n=1 Tax=Halomicronema hongdechloris C2206 TaxID=1641165 RepID=A0A1Z3HL91_9CYAN|nr:hypothetical protein [Halomicronema hongdechloris]ASC71082.1 uncharacterized protein XM38_020320 [Halomicronema hongdechloris C2206]